MEQETKELLEKDPACSPIISKISRAEQIIESKKTFSEKEKEKIISCVSNILSGYSIEARHPSLQKDIISHLKDNIRDTKRFEIEEFEKIKGTLTSKLSEVKMSPKKFSLMMADINSQLSKGIALTEEQANAILKTLTSNASNEKHITWLGVEGAGKTFSLATVVQQAQKEGYEVCGFAQNKSAAKVHSKEIGMPTNTIAKLLYGKKEESIKIQTQKNYGLLMKQA